MSTEDQDYQESENTGTEEGNSEEQSEQQSSEQSAESSGDKDYSQLYENQKTRAEKAEAKLKELRQQLSNDNEDKSSEEQTSKKKLETPSGLTREEAKLYAKGFEDDEIDRARKIAQIEEISVDEAVNSDLFSSWKKNRDTQKKQEGAQVGASHSSSRQKQEKDISSPDLSAEEHKKLWKQQMGK